MWLYYTEEAVAAKKKKVEDVMPIATGHEKEELEAELEVIPNLWFSMHFFFKKKTYMISWYEFALPQHIFLLPKFFNFVIVLFG